MSTDPNMEVEQESEVMEIESMSISEVQEKEESWKLGRRQLPKTTMQRNYLAFNRFILLHKLGKGGFGLIYAGIDIVTGREVAIKLEDISKARKKYLRLEYKIYRRLDSDWYHVPNTVPKCIPQVYYYGQDGGYRILVMELLGVSLSELFVFQRSKFSLKTVCMLAIQMINLVEYFHSKGLLHRDVKPGNFVTGGGDRGNELFLIDYGLASPYIDANGKHIPYSASARFHGTDKYASINNHRKIEPGRRDDLESVGYLLIYFAKGYLPWEKKYPNAQKPERRDLYGQEKLNISIRQLCEYLPRNFEEYFNAVKKLHFCDRPNYEFLRYLFYTTLEELGHDCDWVFDWTLTPGESDSESSSF